MMHKTYVWALVATSVVLSGCDKTKEALGLKREQPDEYTILSRPPLSAPPCLALNPPKAGEKPRFEAAGEDSAKEALGVSGEASARPSSAEDALLTNAKARPEDEKAPSPEREEADDEVPYLFGAPNKGTVIDPKAEQEKYKDKTATTGNKA
ncbi:MAG: DUF3035 domain-containing protein [Proteobacteria bacterium]|nr:DUF3035 domain-containing protein [Pseudomonadota bacterium]